MRLFCDFQPLCRYMKRLGKHPVVRKDAMFRSFIQDKEVAKTLKPLVGFKSAMESMKSGLATFQSKITVTEKDPWFKVNFFFLSVKKLWNGDIRYEILGFWIFPHFLTFVKYQIRISRTFLNWRIFNLNFPHFCHFNFIFPYFLTIVEFQFPAFCTFSVLF